MMKQGNVTIEFAIMPDGSVKGEALAVEAAVQVT